MTSDLASYITSVERFFVVVRMSGFVLSSKDAEKVHNWYMNGVPLHAVLQGIADGYRKYAFNSAPGQLPPHSLSFYSRSISARVRKARKGRPDMGGVNAQGDVSSLSEGKGETETEGHRHGFRRASHTIVPPQFDPMPVIEHLMAEMDLLCLQSGPTEVAKGRARYFEGLDALKGRAAKSHLCEQELHVELLSLDEATLDFYHESLSDERRKALVALVERELAGERGIGNRALEARRRQFLRDRLRDELGLPRV